MIPSGAGGVPRAGLRGPLTGDPLAARLFPLLPDQVRWGLDRTERLLVRVGSPHRGLPVLHVGGTNGKGSVARIWATVLQEAGFRVGLYTSPPLLSFRERILVDGAPLPDELLEELAGELRSHLVKLAPSPFEAFTVLSLLAFHREEVDLAVMEVGMGGRLDATNVVEPILTAVTNVTMEHEAILGPTLADIAREKAGILKPGVPAFTATDAPDALRVLVEEAAARGVPLARVPSPSGTVSLEGIQMQLRTRRWGTLALRSPLVGHHQLRNVALAIRSLEALPPRFLPSRRAVEEGVARARIPGRMQVEAEPPRRWVLDVAHNPAGVAALVETLAGLPLEGPRVGVVGIMEDKAWGEMLARLGPSLDRILLVVAPSAPPARRWDPGAVRASLPEDLREWTELPGAPGRGLDDAQHGGRGGDAGEALAAALARARDLTAAGGTVVVTGSFPVVGDVLRALDRIPAEALPPAPRSG